jgi:hypothetical protein
VLYPARRSPFIGPGLSGSGLAHGIVGMQLKMWVLW